MAGAAIDDILLNISPGGQMALGIVLALIMYGVALDLRVADFVDVFRRPAAPLAGLAAQLILLPAVTWAITMVLKPQPLHCAWHDGGGGLSRRQHLNLITHMARGNTALSVSMTGISSLLASVTTPLNILFWAGLNPQTAALLRQVSVDPVSFIGSTVLLLGVPMVAGLLTVRHLPGLADRLRRPLQILSFVFLIGFILAATGHQLALHLGVLDLGAALRRAAYRDRRRARLGRREDPGARATTTPRAHH